MMMRMNMTTTKIDILKEVIENGNKEQIMLVLENMENNLNDDLVLEITRPDVITKLHAMLIEHIEVNPRAMKLKGRVPGRKRRALLFIRAMKNAVSKAKPKVASAEE